MRIAILNPVDGQPISYRAVPADETLSAGEILFSGDVPAEAVWSASLNAPVAPSDVAIAKPVQLGIVQAQYAAYLAEGYVDATASVTISITAESQALLASDLTGLTAAISAGFVQPTDQMPLLQLSGQPAQLPASDYQAMLGRAWAYCRAAYLKWQALSGQIQAATTVEQAQAVGWT